MKYPTISALCEGVAGAIREKEGSTALINPQDFVDRIKGLEVGGGGIPDVPTLECWKITTEDNDLKLSIVDAMSNVNGIFMGTLDGGVYASLYPLIGTGRPHKGEQSYYFMFFNKGDYSTIESYDYLIELFSQNSGEKISISSFLDVAATVKIWRE